SGWNVELVISANDMLGDADDRTLATVPHPGPLAKDGTDTRQATVTLPDGVAGSFHVFVIADVTNAVFEKQFEDDNVGRTTTPVAVTLKPTPNLVVTAATPPPAAGRPADTASGGSTVANTGAGPARAPCSARVSLSRTGTLTGATLVKTIQHTADLAGDSDPTDAAVPHYDATADVVLPALADGTYYWVIQTDALGQVFE